MSTKKVYVCYLCFSENAGLIGRNYDFDTDVFICNNCGLIQNDFVSGLYLENYYHKNYRLARKEGITSNYLERMSRRASSQHDFIKSHLPNSTKVLKVLDIGAGVGKLLETFSSVDELFAVESDLAMLEYMAQSKTITILDESELFTQSHHEYFNLITMSHVFEHINNPLEYLYKIHQIIAPGGYIFLEVPNEPINLVGFNIKKRKRGIGHLFDYTVDTLNSMIAKSGLFQVEVLSTFSVSVEDYLKGASIHNFEENPKGDGIHIRCLLKRIESNASSLEHKYVDAVLQNRYRHQLLTERNITFAIAGIEDIKKQLSILKTSQQVG